MGPAEKERRTKDGTAPQSPMVQGHALRRGYALLAHSVLNHLWVMPEHFGEWWGYGAFFLVAACAQLLYILFTRVRGR